MASDQRKHRANNSEKSRKPPTHRISPTSLLNDDRKEKETSETAKVEDSRPNSDELLQVYPFVELPVVFTFGGGAYRTGRQILEWRRQILYESMNCACQLHWGEVGTMKYSREDIFELSSVEDMIASFTKDNLF